MPAQVKLALTVHAVRRSDRGAAPITGLVHLVSPVALLRGGTQTVLPISAAASCACSPRRSPSLAGCGPRAAAVLDDAAGDGLGEEDPGPARGRSRRTGRRAPGTAWAEESGGVDQQGHVGVLVGRLPRPPACGPRSWPSFQAFPPSSCTWAALLVAYEQAWSPCPPRTPSNQVRVRVRRLERDLVCVGVAGVSSGPATDAARGWQRGGRACDRWLWPGVSCAGVVPPGSRRRRGR